MDRPRAEYGATIHSSLRPNLVHVCEVRANPIHFFNKGHDISDVVQELGTACLLNYVVLMRQWFAIDMEHYNFFLMPLAFVKQEGSASVVNLNADERRLIDFLKSESSAGGGAILMTLMSH